MYQSRLRPLTCCSGIFSFNADFKSVAVLNPRVALSRQVLSDEPDKALRPRKMDRPLIRVVSAQTGRSDCINDTIYHVDLCEGGVVKFAVDSHDCVNLPTT